MSAINSLTPSLTSFLQGISVGTDSQTNQAASTSGTSSTDSTAATQGAEGHHHHHGGGGAFSKIENAVTTALQSAQSDSSADPNTIIKDAISQVLQGQSGATGSASDAASTNADATTAGGTTDPGTTDNSEFSSMLQSLGVSPQQFHADFLDAVQAAQGGQVDPSTALQSFPPGTTIDTTA